MSASIEMTSTAYSLCSYKSDALTSILWSLFLEYFSTHHLHSVFTIGSKSHYGSGFAIILQTNILHLI